MTGWRLLNLDVIISILSILIILKGKESLIHVDSWGSGMGE